MEFQLHLRRPARAPLRCRAEVLRQGRTLIICEGSVFSDDAGAARRVSKMTGTLAVVERVGS